MISFTSAWSRMPCGFQTMSDNSLRNRTWAGSFKSPHWLVLIVDCRPNDTVSVFAHPAAIISTMSIWDLVVYRTLGQYADGVDETYKETQPGAANHFSCNGDADYRCLKQSLEYCTHAPAWP